jgi:hypothetical protein
VALSADSNSVTPTPIEIKLINPLKDINDLPSLITAILNNIIMPLAAVVVVIMIIYSGFKFITAQGNPGEIEKAKSGLLYVLIGTGVLLGAAGISAAIEGTLKSILN